jgi:dolichol-phosphate mannosyltransferase
MTSADPPPPVQPAPIPTVPRLTVVVPTYNEAENVDPLCDRLALALADIPHEIIFVDDNSPDGTADVVGARSKRDPRVRCIRRIGRRGLSGAAIEGMLAALADIVAVMDGDLQHDETILPAMFAEVADGRADVAVGSRYVPGGNADSFSGVRGGGSRLATAVTRAVLRVPMNDPMSGFFLTRRDVVEAAAPRLSHEGFKILLDLTLSHPRRLRVAEVPFVFGTRLHGASKMDGRAVMDLAALIVSKATGGMVSLRFTLFAAVGLSGVVVHLLALRLLLDTGGVAFPVAQAAATMVAMTTNFALNNALTYRDRALRGFAFVRGLFGFYVGCGFGALANVGIANWVFKGGQVWWIAGLAGAVVGAVWNYVFSTLVVWRPKS